MHWHVNSHHISVFHQIWEFSSQRYVWFQLYQSDDYVRMKKSYHKKASLSKRWNLKLVMIFNQVVNFMKMANFIKHDFRHFIKDFKFMVQVFVIFNLKLKKALLHLSLKTSSESLERRLRPPYFFLEKLEFKDRQTDRPTNRQTDRPTDRPTLWPIELLSQLKTMKAEQMKIY